jgi:hypothetical protein
MHERMIDRRGLHRRPPVARRVSVDSWGVILDTGRCMTPTLRNARSRFSE